MKNILIIFFALLQVECYSQVDNDSKILNCMFAGPEVKADTVYNKRGKIEKITKPTIADYVIDRFTNKISYKIENYESLVRNGLSELDSSTYADFKNKNWQSYQIDSLRIINRKVFLIDTLESKRIVESNDWSSFLQKYPNAYLILSISKIGYNQSKNQALLYSTNKNYLSGKYGFYTLFVFIDKSWRIKQSMMVDL